MVGRFPAPAAADSPRVMPETRCVSKNWGWWPGAESNHRHADFQYDGEPGSARGSRRPGTRFPVADRTAPPDRTYPEPEPGEPSPRPGDPIRFNGLRASRPNLFRTGRLLVLTVRPRRHAGRGAETCNLEHRIAARKHMHEAFVARCTARRARHSCAPIHLYSLLEQEELEETPSMRRGRVPSVDVRLLRRSSSLKCRRTRYFRFSTCIVDEPSTVRIFDRAYYGPFYAKSTELDR